MDFSLPVWPSWWWDSAVLVRWEFGVWDGLLIDSKMNTFDEFEIGVFDFLDGKTLNESLLNSPNVL
jgi:hypothetical protein